MNIQELQQAIEEYPQKYQQALSLRMKAEMTVKRLEEELELERSMPEEPDTGESPTSEGETYDQVRMLLDEKSNEVSLAVRLNPKDHGLSTKPTETAIRTVVNNDPEVKKLKAKLQELRPQRDMRMVRRMHHIQLLSPRAQEIQERLWKAEDDQAEAEIGVEVLEAQLESYKLLTTILTAISR